MRSSARPPSGSPRSSRSSLLRALRRQRALLRVHLASLGERNRELNAFAARTAHDLKGPLSPVKGYADLLSLREEPEVREIAKRITARLRAHGRHHRGPARALGPRQASRRRGHSSRPSCSSSLDELRSDLRDAEVKLELGDCTTACSAGTLSQILRNLVINAAKYRSPSRRLLLRLEARPAGDQVELAICRQRPRHGPRIAAHAFEPLYRAPGASSPGHGLGLAIVKRTVTAIGGTVDLTSTPGEGTRVTVRVPAA